MKPGHILCLLLGLLALRPTGLLAQSAGAAPRPVIVDTDMAADDWIAILYLLQRADVEVRAVTVTGTGEAHCGPGVQNALNLLALAGNPDVPVACGRETPLQGNREFPQSWRDSVDQLAGLTLPPNPNPPSDLTAVDLLTATVQESAEPVTLITLGPLTNVAEALTATPSLGDNLAMVYIMGGAVRVPGNLQPALDTSNTAAEWNLYVDPLAARQVVESGAPVTLVPLDATDDVPITAAFMRALEADRATAEAEFVYQVLRQNQDIDWGYLYFWDTLTAIAATEPGVVQLQGRPLRVIDDEGPESGRTVIDARGQRALIAISAEGERARRILLNVLNGRDPQYEPPPVALSAADLEANKTVARRYFEEVWGQNNTDTRMELVDPRYVGYVNTGEYPTNAEALGETIAAFHQAMPDVQVSVDSLIAEGTTVAARVTITGTMTGEILGLAPTNRALTITLQSVVDVVDGQIVEEWQTYDLLNVLIGFGVVPEDAISQLYAEAP